MSRPRPQTNETSTPRESPRWQVVENVVAAIERVRASLPGMTVRQKVQLHRLSEPTRTRDIDVLVEVPTPARTLVVAVEVKNHKRRLDISQMGSLADLRRDVAVDRFCVVSTSGFTSGAVAKARENGIEVATLEQVESSPLWSGLPGVRFVRRSGELVGVHFSFAETFPKQPLQEALAAATYDAITLEDATGTASLRTFVSHMFREAFKSNPELEVRGNVVKLAIKMEESRYRFHVGGALFPTPTVVTATARVIVETSFKTDLRFRLGDIEVSTSEMDLFGVPRQLSLVAETQPDGSRRLSFSVGSSMPKLARDE